MSLNRVVDVLRVVSPRRRRWQRFLKSLPLDPDRLARPIEAPGERDFIMCGCPRTGTTLLNAVLFQPPSVVTVMEPWDGMRVPPAEIFKSIRREISDTGQLGRGRLNIATLMEKGSVEWCTEGTHRHRLAVEAGYLLGIKWPAFWRYLEYLPETKFLVCLRDPVEVIGSFKKQGGRLGQGLNYDTAFNRRMNENLQSATRDVALRRVLLFEYIHTRLLPYLSKRNVFVVRYERWFTEPETLLAEIGAFLGVHLGPGHAVIRPPRSESTLTSAEITFIQRYCSTAQHLGYRVQARSAVLHSTHR